MGRGGNEISAMLELLHDMFVSTRGRVAFCIYGLAQIIVGAKYYDDGCGLLPRWFITIGVYKLLFFTIGPIFTGLVSGRERNPCDAICHCFSRFVFLCLWPALYAWGVMILASDSVSSGCPSGVYWFAAGAIIFFGGEYMRAQRQKRRRSRFQPRLQTIPPKTSLTKLCIFPLSTYPRPPVFSLYATFIVVSNFKQASEMAFGQPGRREAHHHHDHHEEARRLRG